MSGTDPKANQVRFAAQVHAEAVAIIALRAVAGTIHESDTPAGIRERIKDLIAVKAAGIGLDGQNFTAVVEDASTLIGKADEALNTIMNKVKGK